MSDTDGEDSPHNSPELGPQAGCSMTSIEQLDAKWERQFAELRSLLLNQASSTPNGAGPSGAEPPRKRVRENSPERERARKRAKRNDEAAESEHEPVESDSDGEIVDDDALSLECDEEWMKEIAGDLDDKEKTE